MLIQGLYYVYFSSWILDFSVSPIAGRLADGKVMYPLLFFYFYRTLPVISLNCSLSKF